MNKVPFLATFATLSVCNLTTAKAQSLQLLLNGRFQDTTNPLQSYPPIGGVSPDYAFIPQSHVPGWNTTSSLGTIELWQSGFSGVVAANGNDNVSGFFNGGSQFAEINAESTGALYQDVTFTQSGWVDFFFLHRGRGGSDTVRLSILNLGVNGVYNSTYNNAVGFGNYTTGGDDAIAYSHTFTSDNVNNPGEYNGFRAYAGDDVFHAIMNQTYRFAYGSVTTGSGSPTIGNFIDNTAFGINLQNDWSGGSVNLVPEPGTFGLLGFSCALGLLVRKRR
jgi:hypothetical protein